MSIFDSMKIIVTAHAVNRFRERFPDLNPGRPIPYEIEREVRVALNNGRISPRQPHKTLDSGDPTSLYAWTEEYDRVYALRHDEEPPQFVVTTIMAPAAVAA